MAELLGIGMPHAPMFQFPDEAMSNILKRQLRSPKLPAELTDPQNWPAQMRAEWGDDEGLAAAKNHRDVVVTALRTVRAELDAFDPDFVLVFGDDQYENFKEDLVPTFCTYFFDDMDVLPFRSSSAMGVSENVWGMPEDHAVRVRGHREAGVQLVTDLIGSGFDMAWSMRPHHHPTLGHAFMRTLVYLDYDQRGFPWPMMPIHVNAYGSDIVHKVEALTVAPPAPSPARCFAFGQEIGRILRESPYRVAVVGSSSWSHAFLTPKNHLLWPDIKSDRLRLAELSESRHRDWAKLTLEEIRAAGQHEMLNWICMAGAMADAKAEVLAFGETYVFNSTKVVALLR
jgi:hypothetical protein